MNYNHPLQIEEMQSSNLHKPAARIRQHVLVILLVCIGLGAAAQKDNRGEDGQGGNSKNDETKEGKQSIDAGDHRLRLNGSSHHPRKPNHGLRGFLVKIVQPGVPQGFHFTSEPGDVESYQETE